MCLRTNAQSGCVPPAITAPTVTQPTCATPTGTIVVNATGGGTLEYQLNSGAFQVSNTFSGLAPGSYDIAVRLQSSPTCLSIYSGNPVVLSAATNCGPVPVYFVSVKNGNWDNPSTWLGNVVPTSGANITIKHNVIGNVNTTCNSLRVQSPGSLTVNPAITINLLH